MALWVGARHRRGERCPGTPLAVDTASTGTSAASVLSTRGSGLSLTDETAVRETPATFTLTVKVPGVVSVRVSEPSINFKTSSASDRPPVAHHRRWKRRRVVL